MPNKALVNASSGILSGAYSPPLSFSVAGKTVIELPLGFSPDLVTSSPAITINKINFLMGENPTYTGNIYDELFTDVNIDYVNSTKISTSNGSGKNTSINNTGILQTFPFAFIPNATFVKIYYEIYFLYNRVSVASEPGPDELLYNFDPLSSTFIEPSPTSLTCQYSADAGPFLPVVSGEEINMGGVKANIVLKFINPGNSLFLSSFAILYK
jgi:hypothetical protein